MNIPVKILVRSCAAMISYGTAASEYLESLGVKREKIYISYNSIDVDFYRKIASENKSKKMQLRKKMGITNKYLIIYVGQLITRKGVLDLYEAVKKLKSNLDVGILWVGYGPLEETLRTSGEKDNFKSQYFVTTHNAKETAQMYAIGDIFIMPTHEDIFSNVVSEALAAGLPVITTQENGATRDVMVEGRNGFVIKAGDVNELNKKISLLFENEKLRKEMSENTWSLIKKFNYNENIKSFKDVVNFAINNQ